MSADQRKTVVMYHGNCPDGFGGAWAAWQKLGDAAVYCPVNHGDPPPALAPDANVIMVDFAYSRDLILAMHDAVASLTILDHHKSAQETLGDLDFATFDMDRSGAMMS